MTQPDLTEKQKRLRMTKIIFSTAVVGLAIFVAMVMIKPAMPDRITLLTGPVGSAYHELGQKYAADLRSRGLETEVVVTEGGLQNLELLASGAQDTIAFAPSNIEHRAGAEVDTSKLASIGSVAYEPLWLFHRSDLDINRIGDLAGLKIATGPKHTVVGFVADYFLDASNVTEKVKIQSSEGQTFESIADALIAGDIDAGFLLGAPISPVIRKLLDADAISFTSFEQADAYAALLPGLATLVAPEGVFDLARNNPSEDANLLAATTNLLTRFDVHPAVAPMVLNTASNLHTGGIFSTRSTFPSDEHVSLPLKPSAKRYFEQGEKGLSKFLPYKVTRYLNHLGFVVLPLLAGALILIKTVPLVLKLWATIRLMGFLKRLESVEKSQAADGDSSELLTRLNELDRVSATMFVPRSCVHDYIDFRQFLHDMRERVKNKDDSRA